MRITHASLLSLVGLIALPQVFAQYLARPWPTYSSENMPRTSFTCQGKILGGYYADSETQCQMFHVCVKVAGVGVKDFRFLCPNGTAFDQEAQICADWGDVDCEQSTLYYSSDNFDLYRLGSGFESKRAPVAEDETPFHLQRAESSDARRSQQQSFNNNQNFNRNTVPNYDEDTSSYSNKSNFGNNRDIPKVRTTSTTTTTETSYQADRRGDDEIFKGSHSSNFFNNKNNGKDDDLVDFPQKPQRNLINRGRQRPQNNYRNPYNTISNTNNIQSFPTTSTTTTTTTSTTTAIPTTRYRLAPANTPTRQQSNTNTLTLQSSFRTVDSSDYNNNKNEFTSSTTEISLPQRNYQLTNRLKPNTQQKIQPTTYNPSYNPFPVESTTASYEDFKRFDKVSTASPQQYNQPTQNSFYNAQFENKATERSFEDLRTQEFQYTNPIQNRSAPAVNDFDRVTPRTFKQRVNIQRQNSYNEKQSYEGDLAHSLGEKNNNNNFAQSQPTPPRSRRPNQFRGSKNFNKVPQEDADLSSLNVRPLEPRISTQSTPTEPPRKFEQNLNNPYNNYRSSPQPLLLAPQNQYNSTNSFGFSDNYRPVPSPFSLPPERQAVSNRNSTQQQLNYDYSSQNDFQSIPSAFSQTPRSFSVNPSFSAQNQGPSQSLSTTSKSTNLRKYDENFYDNYTPSTAAKKFSTLVPKDQFYPTTFKPATYKKAIQGYEQKIGPSTKFTAASYLPTTSTTTYRPAVAPNNEKVDEDDGQYHPELYEQDFARNKFKSRQTQQQKQQQQQQQPQQQQSFDRTFERRPAEQSSSSNSDEEEFLNTAHSLNIAAGANQLRAGKTKQSSPATLYRIATTTTTESPLSTSRRPTAVANHKNTKKHDKKSGTNEDTSYDYAYYDSFSGSPQDYAEYDLISEFGKTKKN